MSTCRHTVDQQRAIVFLGKWPGISFLNRGFIVTIKVTCHHNPKSLGLRVACLHTWWRTRHQNNDTSGNPTCFNSPLPANKSLDLEIGAPCATVPTIKLMLKYVHPPLWFITPVQTAKGQACRKVYGWGDGMHNDAHKEWRVFFWIHEVQHR